MTTEKDKNISPLQNSEEHQKLIHSYEEKINQHKAKETEWQNAYLKSEQDKLELTKTNERLTQEKDDWKREAYAAKKVQAETKQHKEQQDFLTEYQKLQAKKGWQYDEATGWTKMTR